MNSDTYDYQLNQFGAWYLLAGIDCYLETAAEVCQCETMLTELDRLEEWEKAHGGFYDHDSVVMGFAHMRQRILDLKADIEASESQHWADKARSEFTVINGGKC